MTISTEAIKSALSALIDPVTGTDYVSGKMFKSAETDENGNVKVFIELGYPAKHRAEAVGQAVGEAVRAAGAASVEVSVTQNIIAHKVQGTLRVMPGVKNIIAVSSGKGGVGKSTVSANLALALAHEGARVGVLDADIYGPSQPKMLGASGQPVSADGKTMEPMESLGLQINSIGFMIEEDDPMIWRGPMAAGALQQLITQTNWHDLDYLIVDMPPGTGDIQLTLSQQVPLTGAVVVTTPQDIALIDAKKGLRMFQKVNVPILGIIENMSVFICPHCGEVEHIFGEGGAKRMSEQYGVPLLGELPLSRKHWYATLCDLPESTSSTNPDTCSMEDTPCSGSGFLQQKYKVQPQHPFRNPRYCSCQPLNYTTGKYSYAGYTIGMIANSTQPNKDLKPTMVKFFQRRAARRKAAK